MCMIGYTMRAHLDHVKDIAQLVAVRAHDAHDVLGVARLLADDDRRGGGAGRARPLRQPAVHVLKRLESVGLQRERRVAGGGAKHVEALRRVGEGAEERAHVLRATDEGAVLGGPFLRPRTEPRDTLDPLVDDVAVRRGVEPRSGVVVDDVVAEERDAALLKFVADQCRRRDIALHGRIHPTRALIHAARERVAGRVVVREDHAACTQPTCHSRDLVHALADVRGVVLPRGARIARKSRT